MGLSSFLMLKVLYSKLNFLNKKMEDKKTKILIVEDEAIVAMNIEKIVKKLGYEVLDIAQSGKEAIRIAFEYKPDLILMDIILSGSLDGVETSKMLLERIDVPIVYLTASSDDFTFQRAKITHPYGYIIKPFSARDIQIAIEIALYKFEMEQKIKINEARYKSLFEFSPVTIWEIDFSKFKTFISNVQSMGITNVPEFIQKLSLTDLISNFLPDIIDINKATLDLYKADNKDHFINNYQQLFPISSISAIKKFFVALYNEDTNKSFESSMKTFANDRIDVLWNFAIAPGFEKSLAKIFLTGYDITTQKMFERRIKDSEERYRMISSLITDLVYGGTINSDGKIFFDWIFGATERIFGYNVAELNEIENGFLSLILNEDYDKYRQKILMLLQNMVVINEYRIVSKGNTVHWLRDYIKPVWNANENRVTNIIGAVQDITVLVNAEKDIAYHSYLLQNVNEGIIAFNCTDLYKITAWNKASESLFNIKREEAINQPLLDIITKNDIINNNEFLQNKILDNQSFIYDTIKEIIAKTKYIEIRFMPLLDSKNNTNGWVALARDVTQQKKAEVMKKELEIKRQEAEIIINRSSVLASIGVISGGILHEINQPLNTIKIASDGLLLMNKKNEGLIPASILSIIESIADSTTRIDKTVKHMRNYWNKSQESIINAIEINKIIDDSLQYLNQKITNQNIKLVLQQSKLPQNIYANETEFSVILNNIINNSINSLKVSNNKEKLLNIKTFSDNEYHIIEVADNGVGLPNVDKKLLFDPFFTTKLSEDSSGLGLAIVKMFVDKFGAVLDVFTNDMGGATFQIKFKK